MFQLTSRLFFYWKFFFSLSSVDSQVDCLSAIDVGMTGSSAVQSIESTTSSPSSFGSGQNNNQGNNSGPSLTNNIEIPSINLSEDLSFKPIEHHQDHIQKQPDIVHPNTSSIPKPCQTSIYSMTTRSKSGISKPKLYLTNTKPKSASVLIENLEPISIDQALQNKDWKQAMDQEYEALMKNDTWVLVPYEAGMNIVDNKCVLRVKGNSDGTIQRYKARRLPRAFSKH